MSYLHGLAGLSSHFLVTNMVSKYGSYSRDPSVIFEAVDVPYSGPLHVLTLVIISTAFVLSLSQMLVVLSLYVMMSILLSISVCAAASVFCA